MMSREKKTSRRRGTEVADFHQTYAPDKRMVKNRFEKWAVSLHPSIPDPIDRLLAALGDIRDKQICEIGCGTGNLTRQLAARGARVSATDISAEAVRIARDKNREFLPQQVEVRQMDAANLLYNDESFNLVTGIWILHHVDIEKAATEISRVLKPGGKAVFIEPLAHNPLSNMWRRLTPSMRTPSEWPLSYSEISEMGRHFSSVKYQEYALLTLLSSLVYLITINDEAKRRSAELLGRLEPHLLRLCKPLRRYSAQILIEFAK